MRWSKEEFVKLKPFKIEHDRGVCILQAFDAEHAQASQGAKAADAGNEKKERRRRGLPPLRLLADNTLAAKSLYSIIYKIQDALW